MCQAITLILGDPKKNNRKRCEDIDAQTSKFIDEMISVISEHRCQELARVLAERRSRLDLATSSKESIVGTCQQILAFGTAGLALSVPFLSEAQKLSQDAKRLLGIAGTSALELVAVSLIVLLVHVWQTRFRYPFLEFESIGNAPAYFYYAAISSATPRREFQTSKDRIKGAALYATDLLKFAKWNLNLDGRQELRTELQQYFLLLSYQGYVNQFSLRLTNLFFYGFLGTILAFIVLVVYVFYIGASR
jgi:hypothetical protein